MENDYVEVATLSKEWREDFAATVTEIILKICVFADKYNFDRDNMFTYFVDNLALLAEMSTIKNFNTND